MWHSPAFTACFPSDRSRNTNRSINVNPQSWSSRRTACARQGAPEIARPHSQPADQYRLETDLPDQARGDRNGICVVAGDRHADRIVRTTRVRGQFDVADRVEGADQLEERKREAGEPLQGPG